MTKDEQDVWTLDEVTAQEARAVELEAKAGELEATVADLSRRIADALAAGEDHEGLTAERNEARALLEDIRAALPVLRQRIAERREAAVRAEATERLNKAIPRAYGSLIDLLAKDAAKVKEAARAKAEAEQRVADRENRIAETEFEAALLSLRFDLPRPAGTYRTQRPPVPPILEGAFRIEPQEDGETVRIVGSRGKRTVGGEVGRILAAAGAWERTAQDVDAEMKASSRKLEAQLQAERDRVDAWLKDRLAGGPVSRDRLFADAEAAGIPARSTPNAKGASLVDARTRLSLLPLETTDGERTPFWSLPDVAYDGETFTVYAPEIDRAGREMAAHMR